jgi:hypothetical protein
VVGERDDRGHRFHIRLVIVCNNGFGRNARTGQGLTKKGFRTGPIPFVAQEHINNLSVLIHGTIQVQFSLPTKAEYFIDRPFQPYSPSMPMERGS